MKIISKADASVGSIVIAKGENEVAEWVADTLRNAGLLVEKKIEVKATEKAVKKVFGTKTSKK
tara:strand:+ start:580 stop:768 length:189 start_codon:yes stop_codon:yes gene_type:complete